jgi:hypothetical protein
MDILSEFGFDPNVVYLGKPCVHGHTLGDTGLTVRHKNTRKQCVTCAQASQKKVKASANAESASFFHDPESDAILEQHGFNTSKFILGSICKKGHEFESTGKGLRYRCGSGRYAGKPKDCAQCIEIQRTQWKKDNHDRYIENNKRYYHENRDRLLERSKACYQAHRQERIAYTAKWEKEYKARDPEGYAAMRKKCDENRRQKHREKINEAKRKKYRESTWKYYQDRYLANKEEHNKRSRDWKRANPEKHVAKERRRRARKSQNHCVHIPGDMLAAHLKAFDGKCAYCVSQEFSHWDHFIPICKGGPEALNNLLPACKRCNTSKNAQDPKEWYGKQAFYSSKQWKKILRILGKASGPHTQLPLL